MYSICIPHVSRMYFKHMCMYHLVEHWTWIPGVSLGPVRKSAPKSPIQWPLLWSIAPLSASCSVEACVRRTALARSMSSPSAVFFDSHAASAFCSSQHGRSQPAKGAQRAASQTEQLDAIPAHIWSMWTGSRSPCDGNGKERHARGSSPRHGDDSTR